MANIDIKHNPNLSAQELIRILSNEFGGKYEVGASALIGADVYVKKSGWIGAVIKIVQRNGKTFLRVNGYAPSAAVRILIYGLITILILNPKWNALIKEITEIVQKPSNNLV